MGADHQDSVPDDVFSVRFPAPAHQQAANRLMVPAVELADLLIGRPATEGDGRLPGQRYPARVRMGCLVALPAFERRLARASKVLSALTEFLEQVAALLRQLVHAAGWLVVLVGCVSLLIHPHLSSEHVIVPGAGALAVLQSLIRPRRQHSDMDKAVTLDEELIGVDVTRNPDGNRQANEK